MKLRALMPIALLLAMSACSTSGSKGWGWPFEDDATPGRERSVRSSPESGGPEPLARTERGGLGKMSPSLGSPRGKLAEAPVQGRLPPDAVIKFQPDNQQLSRDAEARLQAIAQQVKADEKLILRLEGFVPEGGSPALNLGLAEKSLLAVKARLVELRIPARRILMAPFGEEHRMKRDTLQHWVEIYLVRPRL